MSTPRAFGSRPSSTLGLVLIACALAGAPPAWPESLRAPGNTRPMMMESESKPRASRWVALGPGGASATRRGPEIMTSVRNVGTRPIRVEVRFTLPGQDTPCLEEAWIDPDSRRRFACLQPELHPGADYPVEIAVHTSGQRRAVERVKILYRFDTNQVDRLARHIDRLRSEEGGSSGF